MMSTPPPSNTLGYPPIWQAAAEAAEATSRQQQQENSKQERHQQQQQEYEEEVAAAKALAQVRPLPTPSLIAMCCRHTLSPCKHVYIGTCMTLIQEGRGDRWTESRVKFYRCTG